ncbi:MAG: hypothetical protein MAG471_00323 [Acidimicrobiaceae bacterium]|nr:hypothetical protein [Acidimicrobiaceae bacterium]
MGGAGHHDVTVGGDGQAAADVRGAADCRGDEAVRVEGGVEHPGRREAHHGHVVVGAVVGRTRHHDVAVGGHRDRVAVVMARSHGNQNLAVIRKVSIQDTSRCQSHDRYIEVRPIGAVTSQNNVSV